jgi:hypothetical protein
MSNWCGDQRMLMRKYFFVLGCAIVVAVLVVITYLMLQNSCSSDTSATLEPIHKNRAEENTKDANPGDQSAAPRGKASNKPTASFDLRITEPNKIEGNYYGTEGNREISNWRRNFWCDTKVGEFSIAIFNLFLVIFTGGLWWSTNRLWKITTVLAEADRPHMSLSELSATGLHGRPDAEGFVTLTLNWKFTNLGKSPARIQDLCIMLWTGDEYPEPIPYRGTVTTRYIIGVNGWYGLVKPSTTRTDATSLVKVLRGEYELSVVGRLRYKGAFSGSEYVSRFCYQLLMTGDGSERYIPAGPESYWEDT